MYNPTKPSGKYHFRLCMCCCATSWIALNFRLHCTSSLERRVEGIINDAETRDLQHDLKSTNKVRQHVLEVVHSFNGSGRIVNSDNYYTSVQLLDALRVKGLYGRGTVRRISKHFPRHVILEESKNRTQATAAKGGRGACRQGVSLEHRMIAASWCDGNIVTVASNADPSEMTQVTRMVGGERQQFSAPVCIREYNNHMQGVDRNDQLRGRFSITDSHSFKKWFKKLGAGVVDIARVNAYLTRQLALGANTTDRDPHRRFVVDLVTELITGRWRDAPGSDSMMVHSSGRGSLQARSPNPRARIPNLASPAPNMSSPNPSGCTALASRQVFPNSRKKRQCVVCRFENRPPTEVTAICSSHGVCLCEKVYPDDRLPFACDRTEWTCWEKFHGFYLTKNLFSRRGYVNTSSELYKTKQLVTTTSNSRPSRVRALSFIEECGTDQHNTSFDFI